MNKYHDISNVSFEGNFILLTVDSNNYRIDLRRHSKRLLDANNRVKTNYVISPSGYGIHWPEIDEDLSIDGLIWNKRES